MTDHDRVPPQSLEAEAALLGALLVDHDLLDSVGPLVRPSDFYAMAHETIYQAVLTVNARGGRVDKITVLEELQRFKALERVGGASYLSALMETVQTTASATYYAKIVAEKASLRRLIDAGRKIEEMGYDGEVDAGAALANASTLVARLAESSDTNMGRSMSQLGTRLDALLESGELTTYDTPYPTFNKATGGFAGGELNVWAADPKVGKTGLVNGLAVYTAWTFGHVAHFSTEMGDMPNYQYLLALLSGVSVRKQRYVRAENPSERLSEKEVAKLADARGFLDSLQITMFDAVPSLSSEDIRKKCRRLNRQNRLHAVVVDNVGYLEDVLNPRRGETEHQSLSRAIITLRGLAKELNTVVHLVYHLSRPTSGNAKLSAFRLRGGGNPEGHANGVFLLNRDLEKPDDDTAQLIVERARSSASGVSIPMRVEPHRGLWLERNQGRPWFESPDPEQGALFTEQEAFLTEQQEAI